MSANDRPLLGMALMIVCMTLIPMRDGLAKHLSAELPPLFLAWCSYAGGAILSAPLAARGLRGDMLTTTALAPQLLRTGLLVAALCLFFLAVARIPMADAFGAYFIAPIVAALLAPALLGERLTAATLIAAGAGFAGAMLIVQPGAAMDVGSLYALGSGFCFGAYLVATRSAAAKMPPLPMLLIQNVFGALLLAPTLLLLDAPIGWTLLPWLAALGAVAVLSHYFSISAFRFAEASLLAPLVYVEIVSGAAIGYFAFGDWPTPLAWAGIGLIVGSGLLLMATQRRPRAIA